MYKTLHHIKLIGETFWREVVDRQARRGAYEMTRNVYDGVEEIRPAAGSYVQMDFQPPTSYRGELADYSGKAYLVCGNLGALIGVENDMITFAEGETEKTFSLEGGAIPVGGHIVYIDVNRRGSNGSKMNYTFGFGSTVEGTAYSDQVSAMVTAPDEEEWDRWDTLTYNFKWDKPRTLTSIKITRTASQVVDGGQIREVYPEIEVTPPYVYIPDTMNQFPCLIGNSSVKEITWTGDDASKRVKVEYNQSWWVVLEPDADGKYPRCKAQVMGSVENGFADTWGRLNELDSGKVDKVTGKGLSTNDYTTAEKTKLAGITGMGGATASAAGKAGMVPQPAAGDQMKYLRGDGAWDDIRPALLSPYPVKASALDSMNMLATGAQAGASDAAAGVPPYQLRLKITAASASAAVITVKNYVESVMGGTGTQYTVDLTKANGGQAVNQNTIVDIWDGLRMTIGNTEAYLSEAIVQKDSYIVITCDVGEVGMYYRQGLTNVLTALENRIAALENA